MSRTMKMSLILSFVAGAIATSAQADIVVSATYDDASGSWDGTTFRARAVSGGGLNTSGSVARLEAPIGTASFAPGFVAGADSADLLIELSSTPTIDPTLRDGTGTFTFTDVDGDTISGTISGTWEDQGFAIFFNGALSNVVFSGSTFDGNTGSFLSPAGIFEGALTQLQLSPPASFFTGNYDRVPTGITAQIIPTPGALALLGLGGLVAGRRRTR
jgi:hypothetical protein